MTCIRHQPDSGYEGASGNRGPEPWERTACVRLCGAPQEQALDEAVPVWSSQTEARESIKCNSESSE